ncbi:uncharacterized protein A1O5_00477 [Cladophialophora psammophila CBS 110553]|uniref:Glucose-methanol-choline oxidoreductase N-terminal domain-containing protein n=1 Tax=Cladophialophora psammophila CBS 110553 TaxID=1182543 RepID=W9Y0F8_9EURO|nr:uncharacterized protein A1O5_00477 [Cladophialophora psammophila CBS 110553]EXJ75969.1 hypothetical protein A1O5_00477 [Cladophialophora psammophila CBS 110553]
MYLSTLITLTLAGAACAKPIKKIKRQTIQDTYDFIIAGGGTAGLVIANRLTECPSTRVLVLEAGPEPGVVANYMYPGGNQNLAGTAIDYNYYTLPQKNLNNRILPYHRGRGLGGSSAINGLYYGRGSASVYDHWVQLGNQGWGWDDLYPLSIKQTHFNPPNLNDSFDHSFQTWDPTAYSNGELQIAFQGYVPDSNVGFIRAGEAIGIPIVNELNNGNNTGVKQGTGCFDSRLRRSSSYDAFYKPVQNRTSLDVLHYASVTSIQFTKGSNGASRATGVSFTDQPTGQFITVNATKEVIVAMGAFNSPQLLMISGIGPQAQLSQNGINPVHINENVGQNLNDHCVFSIMALVEQTASTSSMSVSASTLEAAQQQFLDSLTGPYTAPSGITNGFQQLSNATLRAIGAQAVLNAGLVNQSHVEFLYESLFYPSGLAFLPSSGGTSSTGGTSSSAYYVPQSNLSYISLTASPLVALSRGSVTLKSASIFDAPNIDPNYYSNETDRVVAINAFKDLRKLLAHPAIAQFTIGPNNGEVQPGLAHIPANASDDTIFDYIKANTIPNWHASGTCQMLPEADGGVVDSHLRVYGVQNLRVCDVSIIPRLPDVNLQGPVFMIGEKSAQIIKEDYNLQC